MSAPDFGVDLSKLGDQFGGYIPGRTLILDGDGPAYVAAATRKTLQGALSLYQSSVLTSMFLCGAERARVHLTASGSAKAGRFNIIATKPYQGQRVSKNKPPLLEPLRYALENPQNWLPEFEVILHHKLEADDGMIIDAHIYKDEGVIRSEDKDLRMTPYPYWDIKNAKLIVGQGFGHIYADATPGGEFKLLGYGRKFFWAQMLMGDAADNVAGITRLNGALCGPRGAYEALKGIDSEGACARFVIDAYRANKQNILPEGWLLWLLRRDGDNFWTYLSELGMHEEFPAYFNWCHAQTWFKKPEPKEEDEL